MSQTMLSMLAALAGEIVLLALVLLMLAGGLAVLRRP